MQTSDETLALKVKLCSQRSSIQWDRVNAEFAAGLKLLGISLGASATGSYSSDQTRQAFEAMCLDVDKNSSSSYLNFTKEQYFVKDAASSWIECIRLTSSGLKPTWQVLPDQKTFSLSLMVNGASSRYRGAFVNPPDAAKCDVQPPTGRSNPIAKDADVALDTSKPVILTCTRSGTKGSFSADGRRIETTIYPALSLVVKVDAPGALTISLPEIDSPNLPSSVLSGLAAENQRLRLEGQRGLAEANSRIDRLQADLANLQRSALKAGEGVKLVVGKPNGQWKGEWCIDADANDREHIKTETCRAVAEQHWVLRRP